MSSKAAIPSDDVAVAYLFADDSNRYVTDINLIEIKYLKLILSLFYEKNKYKGHTVDNVVVVVVEVVVVIVVVVVVVSVVIVVVVVVVVVVVAVVVVVDD